MREITSDELTSYGISMSHHIMDNGERRFRMLGADGSAYIRTEASQTSGWQNSHYHTSMQELYFVGSGWIVMASLVDKQPVLQRVEAGETFITQPGIAHNCYMGPNAVTHTVKFGDTSHPDWIASPELDALLSQIPQPD